MRYKSAPANIRYAPHIRPIHIGIVAVAILLATGATMYFVHAQNEAKRLHAAKLTELRGELSRMESAQKQVRQEMAAGAAISKKAQIDLHHATDASIHRHDNAVGPHPSLQVNYDDAILETTYVSKLVDDVAAMNKNALDINSIIQSQLGADATRQYLTDLQQEMSNLRVAVADWETGANDILDNDKLQLADSTYEVTNSQEIDQLYQKRDELLAQSQSMNGALLAESTALKTQFLTQLQHLREEIRTSGG